MTVVHLIRHGEPSSGWGEPGGSPDPGLSLRGAAQALAAADHLSTLPEDERCSRVISSPLLRCRQTAAPFGERLRVSVIIDPAVAEIPTPAHLSSQNRVPWLRAVMDGRWEEVDGFDGEAWRADVVASLLQAGGAAVFTHFVAINAAVTAAQGSPRVLAFHPAPASITTLRIEGSRLHVVRLGEALPAAGRVL